MKRKATSRGVEWNDIARTPFFSYSISLQLGLIMEMTKDGSIETPIYGISIKRLGGECLENLIHRGIELCLDFNIESSRLRLETYSAGRPILVG